MGFVFHDVPNISIEMIRTSPIPQQSVRRPSESSPESSSRISRSTRSSTPAPISTYRHSTPPPVEQVVRQLPSGDALQKSTVSPSSEIPDDQEKLRAQYLSFDPSASELFVCAPPVPPEASCPQRLSLIIGKAQGIADPNGEVRPEAFFAHLSSFFPHLFASSCRGTYVRYAIRIRVFLWLARVPLQSPHLTYANGMKHSQFPLIREVHHHSGDTFHLWR